MALRIGGGAAAAGIAAFAFSGDWGPVVRGRELGWHLGPVCGLLIGMVFIWSVMRVIERRMGRIADANRLCPRCGYPCANGEGLLPCCPECGERLKGTWTARAARGAVWLGGRGVWLGRSMRGKCSQR